MEGTANSHLELGTRARSDKGRVSLSRGDLEERLRRAQFNAGVDSRVDSRSRAATSQDGLAGIGDRLSQLESSLVERVESMNAEAQITLDRFSMLDSEGLNESDMSPVSPLYADPELPFDPSLLHAGSNISGIEDNVLKRLTFWLGERVGGISVSQLRQIITEEMRRSEQKLAQQMREMQVQLVKEAREALTNQRESSMRLQHCESELQTLKKLAVQQAAATAAAAAAAAQGSKDAKAAVERAALQKRAAELQQYDSSTLHAAAGQLQDRPDFGLSLPQWNGGPNGHASRPLQPDVPNPGGSLSPDTTPLPHNGHSSAPASNSQAGAHADSSRHEGRQAAASAVRDQCHNDDGTLHDKTDALHGKVDGLGSQLESIHHLCDGLREGLGWKHDALSPSKGRSSLEDLDQVEDGKVFLNRRKLKERLKLEGNIEMSAFKIANFFSLLIMFIQCLGQYKPNVQISHIHNNLHNKFDTESAMEATDHGDIIEYIDSFLETAYTMAPALIDANTMNSIDFARCTDSDVGDVCRLTYWMSIGLTPQDKENINRIIMDQVTESNARSILDCAAGSAPSNCVNRKEQLIAEDEYDKTLGLLPEDPIIFESRLDYPLSSVVPLTPIVWQSRATREECSGFGDKYNYEILGAGLCGVEDDCDPESVTEFLGTKAARRTNRSQSFYFTYSEAPFFCVDRAKYAAEFRDKSWHPWVTRQDLVEGVPLPAAELGGVPIFYKFISDVAYLQRPVNGSVLLDTSGNCNNTCDDPSEQCMDPAMYAEHPLWQEEGDNRVYLPQEGLCTLRAQWTKKYLSQGLDERMNAFLTLETTSLTVSVLVITPQPAAYSDVQTLVRITWVFDQGGTVECVPLIQSTSQTTESWKYMVVVTVVMAWCHLNCAIYDIYYSIVSTDGSRKMRMRLRHQAYIDIIIALGAMAVVITNFVLEILPPDVSAALLDAFKTNSQETYFAVFRSIVMYNENMQLLNQFGFMAVCLLFVRLILFFSLHPRLAVLVSTLVNLADNLFHFMIYFALIFTILGFLGFWMFSAENAVQFGTFGSAIYTQVQMFVGEIPWPDGMPDAYFYIYLLLYIFVVFVTLMNFLLAIIVSAYTRVQEETEFVDTEQNVVVDFVDILQTYLYRRRMKFPSPARVYKYLDAQEDHDATPAPGHIGAHELAERVRHPKTNKPFFKDSEHAQHFVDFYLSKLQDDDGISVMQYAADQDSAACSPDHLHHHHHHDGREA
eukprot:TRINITY_DN3891_c0_g1_i1.p1 TRINITY_DN3891_c0_g1~~TRINITY_DN3891_c0_g1_i1.p1  ORF type:complete len:1255 (+),score=150.39 TRINITY_DN3891_c0_g1_i1:76-3765(+)